MARVACLEHGAVGRLELELAAGIAGEAVGQGEQRRGGRSEQAHLGARHRVPLGSQHQAAVGERTSQVDGEARDSLAGAGLEGDGAVAPLRREGEIAGCRGRAELPGAQRRRLEAEGAVLAGSGGGGGAGADEDELGAGDGGAGLEGQDAAREGGGGGHRIAAGPGSGGRGSLRRGLGRGCRRCCGAQGLARRPVRPQEQRHQRQEGEEARGDEETALGHGSNLIRPQVWHGSRSRRIRATRTPRRPGRRHAVKPCSGSDRASSPAR